MADNTKIEWSDATWNPITGCSVASPGCTNCYAMKLAGTRLAHHPSRAGLTRDTKAGPVWTGEVRFNEQWLTQPLKWKRPRMVFVCAHGDLFHESVPDEWIDRVFAVMALAPQHKFQVLTKRAKRMSRYSNDPNTPKRVAAVIIGMAMRSEISGGQTLAPLGSRLHESDPEFVKWPIQNIWNGVSTEDQRRADERIPDLLATPAAVRWVSAEPLLGPIDFTRVAETAGLDPHWSMKQAGLDWIVAGGESGPDARPMHHEWARSIRDQCAAAGVPFLFKQWGEWAPVCALSEADIDALHAPAPEDQPEARRACKVDYEVMHNDGSLHGVIDRDAFIGGVGAMTIFKIGKKRAGRLLDGMTHDRFPLTEGV